MLELLPTIIPIIEFLAVVVALCGMWYVASIDPAKQAFGFKLWLISNGMWVVYGLLTGNWLLIVQFATFFFVTILGVTNRK